MDFDTSENVISRMMMTRVSRKTALRGLLGGVAVVLTAAGVATSDVEAVKKTHKPGENNRKAANKNRKAGKKNWKSGKRHKARKHKTRDNTSCTVVPTDGTASVPMSNETSPGQIIIEDPCEAFFETCCKDSVTDD
jgi:hypothetical protein